MPPKKSPATGEARLRRQTSQLTPQTSSSGAGYRLGGFLIIIFFACLGLVWLWLQLPKRSEPPVTPPPVTVPVVEAPVEVPEPEPEPVFTGPVRERPVGVLCDEQNFICVDERLANSTLTSPFTATGTGIAFENTINWRLVGSDGSDFASGFTTASSSDVGIAGSFEIRAFLPWINAIIPKTGTLIVYEISAKDGLPIHEVKIPVKFDSAQTDAHIYFSDLKASKAGECSKTVRITTKMPRTRLPVEGTMRRLLVEDSSSDLGSEDVMTQIPELVELKSLTLANGTVTVVFNEKLEDRVTDACRASAIRAQIESTLKQFSSVKNVVISVEGKTPETTLIPNP